MNLALRTDKYLDNIKLRLLHSVTEEDNDAGEEDKDAGEEDKDAGEEDKDAGEEDKYAGEEDKYAGEEDKDGVLESRGLCPGFGFRYLGCHLSRGLNNCRDSVNVRCIKA